MTNCAHACKGRNRQGTNNQPTASPPTNIRPKPFSPDPLLRQHAVSVTRPVCRGIQEAECLVVVLHTHVVQPRHVLRPTRGDVVRDARLQKGHLGDSRYHLVIVPFAQVQALQGVVCGGCGIPSLGLLGLRLPLVRCLRRAAVDGDGVGRRGNLADAAALQLDGDLQQGEALPPVLVRLGNSAAGSARGAVGGACHSVAATSQVHEDGKASRDNETEVCNAGHLSGVSKCRLNRGYGSGEGSDSCVDKDFYTA
mmetsp:Transcript_61833/g.191572  ORF Transcript_61833/g.191572 Transcript_61833/m.191572 type:complete len:253 (+) Transcript_61833:147-905(+)